MNIFIQYSKFNLNINFCRLLDANTSRNESESDEKSTSPFIAKPIPIEFKKKMDEWILKVVILIKYQ